jgi:putative MATE family efflux protein
MSEKQNFEDQDLTRGSVFQELWSIAWPMMLSVFCYTLYNVVDAFWVSKISPEAIAAVSISQINLQIMASLSMGISIGSSVIMSMNLGAKDNKEAERVLGQSFVLVAILAVIFTIISLIFRYDLLLASGANGTIFAPAMTYFTITSAGSILFFILISIMFAFNSQGDTLTLTKLFALSTIVNVILDPIFIFGWFGFPILGIAGAAYATLISQLVFIVVSIYSLSSKHRHMRFHFYNLTLKWDSVKEVLNIGVPASLTQIINPLGLAGLLFITGQGFHEAGTVAFSIGSRVEFLGFLPAVGFGFGAMALIGQNIGAGNLKRAKESYFDALKYGFLSGTGLGIVAAICAGLITRIFTTDPEVTKHALTYIWIVSLSYGFLAAAMVEANAFQAIGKSWPGFWIFFLKFIGISIPVAYFSTELLHQPNIAVWIGLVAGNVIPSVIGYFWVKNELNKVDLKHVPVH